MQQQQQQQQQVTGRVANGHAEGTSDSLTMGRHLQPANHQQDAAQEQQPQQRDGTAATALAQQHRQQQLEQLQRLGLASHAPARSIYDRLHTLKPARLPTRKCLQVRWAERMLSSLVCAPYSAVQHSLLVFVPLPGETWSTQHLKKHMHSTSQRFSCLATLCQTPAFAPLLGVYTCASHSFFVCVCVSVPAH
jgi:hypothetical protein